MRPCSAEGKELGAGAPLPPPPGALNISTVHVLICALHTVGGDYRTTRGPSDTINRDFRASPPRLLLLCRALNHLGLLSKVKYLCTCSGVVIGAAQPSAESPTPCSRAPYRAQRALVAGFLLLNNHMYGRPRRERRLRLAGCGTVFCTRHHHRHLPGPPLPSGDVRP